MIERVTRVQVIQPDPLVVSLRTQPQGPSGPPGEDAPPLDAGLVEIAGLTTPGALVLSDLGIWVTRSMVRNVSGGATGFTFTIATDASNLWTPTMKVSNPATARSVLGFPDLPTSDGNYVLTCTVTAGTPTLSWESA